MMGNSLFFVAMCLNNHYAILAILVAMFIGLLLRPLVAPRPINIATPGGVHFSDPWACTFQRSLGVYISAVPGRVLFSDLSAWACT